MAAYFLPLVLAPSTCMEALRSQLLFSPVLNVASEDTTFSVGAGTHRPDPKLAARLSWKPEQPAEWCGCLVWGLPAYCYLLTKRASLGKAGSCRLLANPIDLLCIRLPFI
jgi:hypothetical protein